MVKEGYYFGIPPLLLGVIFLFLHCVAVATVLALFGLFCFSFFRNPERAIPAEPGAVVSPAHGPIGLAIVRREAEPGTELTVGEDGVTAEVVALPFG